MWNIVLGWLPTTCSLFLGSKENRLFIEKDVIPVCLNRQNISPTHIILYTWSITLYNYIFMLTIAASYIFNPKWFVNIIQRRPLSIQNLLPQVCFWNRVDTAVVFTKIGRWNCFPSNLYLSESVLVWYNYFFSMDCSIVPNISFFYFFLGSLEVYCRNECRIIFV